MPAQLRALRLAHARLATDRIACGGDGSDYVYTLPGRLDDALLHNEAITDGPDFFLILVVYLTWRPPIPIASRMRTPRNVRGPLLTKSVSDQLRLEVLSRPLLDRVQKPWTVKIHLV